MGSETKIKICGLSTGETVDAAISAGVDYLGFVFFNPSPRNISFEQAKSLNSRVAGRAKKVALTVDGDDAQIEAIVSALTPDFLQFHGSETPDRVAEIRQRTGLPVIKAIKIRGKQDLTAIDAYSEVADMLLFDAKMPDDAANALPGGNGLSFDWSLLGENARLKPFMLSGGLDVKNVARAIEMLHPSIVDVSSGVEHLPGQKDPGKIKEFADAVKSASKQDHAA